MGEVARFSGAMPGIAVSHLPNDVNYAILSLGWESKCKLNKFNCPTIKLHMKLVSLGLAITLGSLIPRLLQAEEITTREGKTYHAAEVERVQPDGIILRYQPPGGGVGSAKLKFAILPEKLQRTYAYDPRKAAAFETDQVQAQQALQNEYWSEYVDATNRIAIRMLEEEKQAEIEAKNAELLAQKAQAEQERIAKEASLKAESDFTKTNFPSTEVIYVWTPTGGYVPLQYQPPKDGKYCPPVPLDQVPPLSQTPTPVNQIPQVIPSVRNGQGRTI